MNDDMRKLGTYTSWSGRKSYIDELEMVQNAVEDEEGLEALKEYLRPLASIVIDKFTLGKSSKESQSSKFAEAAFTHLSFAVRKYIQRKEDKGTAHKFSTYYEWYMRQGLSEYSDKIEGT